MCHGCFPLVTPREPFTYTLHDCCLINPLYISVKATKKLKSCACCIPGEESDEEDEDSDTEGGESSKPKKGMDLSVPGAFATNTGGRSKYVDGKSQFAFDPTMFNK